MIVIGDAVFNDEQPIMVFVLEVVDHQTGQIQESMSGDAYVIGRALPNILLNLNDNQGVTIVPR